MGGAGGHARARMHAHRWSWSAAPPLALHPTPLLLPTHLHAIPPETHGVVAHVQLPLLARRLAAAVHVHGIAVCCAAGLAGQRADSLRAAARR